MVMATLKRKSEGKSGNKMGKFGVGLPQASLSQCKRLEVFSWTDGGPENANWTFFDFDHFDETFHLIAEPKKKKVLKNG